MESEVEVIEVPYPLCVEFTCERYWATGNIVSWIIMISRLSIAVLILLLGTKMGKDFMRSITMMMFIPITVAEIFNIYCEAANFVNHFSATADDSQFFYVSYIDWTTKFVYVLYDYIHYNCIVMMILLLHCCRLAYRDGDMLNPFPINTLCIVLQIIPFFLCILIYVEEGASLALKIISVVARVFTVAGFSIITVQLLMCMYLVTKLLPYNHAASADIQLQDARSRLAWTLMYMIIPYTTLLPFLVESVTWIAVMGETDDVSMQHVQVITEILKYLVHYYRSTWMVVLTMTCLPPYRRAVPLLFCCCGCYQVKVDPLPRKPVDTSLMYKHADADAEGQL